MTWVSNRAVDRLRAQARGCEGDDAASDRLKTGDVLGDRFELLDLVGAGGMGQVYRAWDRRTARHVAVKVAADPGDSAVRRLAREAVALAQLSHPAVVPYVDSGSTPQGELYLAMELLEGESLAERLARGRMPIREAVVVARAVADALAAAHRRGLVHRDVKPGNVFLVGGSVEAAKLLDFGLVRGVPDASSLTTLGAFIGTVGYVAPEQVRGEREADPRADLFSLGCVLHECVSGEPAFRGNNLTDALARILLASPPRLRASRKSTPPELEALVVRLLEKDPDARPPDAQTVVEALDAILAELPTGEGDALASTQIDGPVVPKLPPTWPERPPAGAGGVAGAAGAASAPTLKSALPHAADTAQATRFPSLDAPTEPTEPRGAGARAGAGDDAPEPSVPTLPRAAARAPVPAVAAPVRSAASAPAPAKPPRRYGGLVVGAVVGIALVVAARFVLFGDAAQDRSVTTTAPPGAPILSASAASAPPAAASTESVAAAPAPSGSSSTSAVAVEASPSVTTRAPAARTPAARPVDSPSAVPSAKPSSAPGPRDKASVPLPGDPG